MLFFLAADELALLFTGSPAPPTALGQLQQAHESASTELDENSEGNDEGDYEAKDEVALSPIPPSPDSPSPTGGMDLYTWSIRFYSGLALYDYAAWCRPSPAREPQSVAQDVPRLDAR